MVLLLSESDVSRLLTMADGVALMEQAFSDFANGNIIIPPRISQDLPGTAGALRVVSAVIPAMGSFGLKTLTGYPGRRTAGECYFAILLFEINTGALRAIISANYLTGVRTGAATGVAVKYLAREDAHIHGVLGAGAQARFQIEAITCVRTIELVKIFSRNTQKASALALSITAELGIGARVVNSPEDAVSGSGIVTAVTTSREPIIMGKWLDEGTHITSVGANTRAKRELDPTCFSRSKVITDCTPLALEEAGDLRAAIESGDITPNDIHAELGEVVNGTKTKRVNDHELTVFKSIGIGFQDIAVASFLYERAVQTGTGTMVSLEEAGLPSIVAPLSS